MNSSLKTIKEFVYDPCGLVCSNFTQHSESVEYEACSFELNGKKIQHRVSKITPTKTGQFVAIWKRNQEGKTEPYHSSDDLDFMCITSVSGADFGQFMFPKSVLIEKGILTTNTKSGKRGMRVYPPWDVATNQQAQKTQAWQLNYFFTVNTESFSKFELIDGFFRNSKQDLCTILLSN